MMKKRLFLTVIFALTILGAVSAQDRQKKFSCYPIGFYNLENLFDTCHDAEKNDYDFLPDGSYQWTAMKYKSKLKNMSRVLSEMGTDKVPMGCVAIGVSEVENANCLRDLCNQPPLKARDFQFVHIEGPDKRGVDCALLYNPKLFTVRDTKLVPYVYTQPQDIEAGRQTRGFFIVSGTLADEHVTIIVCHLPSRFSGSEYREQGAEQVRVVKDSLLNDDPNCKIMIMGDMNDDPTNRSMAVALRGKANIEEVGPGDMYNPWYNVLVKEKRGTLKYQGAWNLFDQILLSPALINKVNKKDFSSLKYFQHQVFDKPYLFNTEGRYKGDVKRTTAGGVWLDGYSDHLPVVVYLLKEQQ